MSSLGIERLTGPVVRASAGLPGIQRPGVMAKLTRVRDGMKRPTQLSGSHIIGANVAGRCRERLGIPATKYHQVLIDDAWASQVDGLRCDRLPAQIFPEVDSPVVA